MKVDIINLGVTPIFICEGCGGIHVKEDASGKYYYEDIFSNPSRILCFHCASSEQERGEIIHGK